MFLAALLLIGAGDRAASRPAALDAVVDNDNTRPAGTLVGDTLRLSLVLRYADWHPESDTAPALRVQAFAEEGKAPTIPAPLIRVREGTIVIATVRNALGDSTATIRGLNTHPSPRDSMILAPDEARTVTFTAGAPGTYLYRARFGKKGPADEREQAAGAFVVDPPGGSLPDRIFVINIWAKQFDSLNFGNALTINGRSWPWTERIHAVVGDTMRWRVVNASDRPHPMHLHGAYFRVDSKGGTFRDTTYAPDQRRLAVTEEMYPGQTMNIAWSPVRPGRWVFHCHITFHVAAPAANLDQRMDHSMSNDPLLHMAGLIVGIDAELPPGGREAPRGRARTLDLFVQAAPKRARADRALSFILQRDARPPAADSAELPGSLLVLTRGQPTDVRVHNRLAVPTAIHWHGLELESFSDGVPGWGVTHDGMPTPPVDPGGTFTARLSAPRAGTFIYHTHMRDLDQLTSGLYGPLVVIEPGKRFDPRTDHVIIVGWDQNDREPVHLLINGDSVESPPIALRVGEPHRLRFINIGAAGQFEFTLAQDSTLTEWRPIAKDGADLPLAQQRSTPSKVLIDVGETFDFAFTPTRPGTWVLWTIADEQGHRWTRRLVVR